MTTAADDSTVEDAFGAYLAGRPVPDEAAGLAAFVGAVRETATRPGRPNAALAELLATGLLTDQPSPSTWTARSAGSPPSRRASRIRRRRRFAMLFPALLAKLLSAGAVAQAATGAGIVVVAFTGAGAAGILPAPVQDTFSSIAGTDTSDGTTPTEDAATETEAPATETEAPEVEQPAAPTPKADAAAGLTLEEWQQGPAPDQPFGSWVSAGARQGYVDGPTVREWAHKRNEERRDGSTETTAPSSDEPVARDEDSATPDSPEVEVESGGHGGGNQGGRGHGGR
jgi:hypothetical protein